MRRAGCADVRRAGAVIGAALALLGATGCNEINKLGPNCDRSPDGNPPVRYVEGTVEGSVYMSTPWDGGDEGLLWFPGGMRYELVHGLGDEPRFVELWLSFDRFGTKSSTVALASGNQAELRTADADKLIIVNGSCIDYWLLVVAGTGDTTPQMPIGDAGAEDAGP
jgi:hypothetical protein